MAQSANQLYNLSKAGEQGLKFSDWLSSEKALYQSKIQSGSITGQMQFLEWLNKRWIGKAKQMNVIGMPILDIDLESAKKATQEKGTVGSVLKDVLKGSIKKTLDNAANKGDSSGGSSSGSSNYMPAVEKRVLGMKPVVAYTIGTVLFLGTVAGVIYLVKKSRAQA